MEPASSTVGGQTGDGGGLEDRLYGDVGPEDAADAADQAHGQQRVAAEGEEVVVHPDPGYAQDLGEDGAEEFLAQRRRPARRARARRLGGGQRRAVHLAVGGQRQPVQDDDGVRHEVLGQPAGDELVDVREGFAGRRRHVGHQALVAGGVLADGDDGLGDGGVSGQDLLDLAGLDPEPADLHLVVGPGHELQRAVGPSAHDVSGAVHAGAGYVERAGHEPLGGESGAGDVAAGESGARDVRLARDARRDRAEAVVEDVHAGVVHGAADGHDVAQGVGVGERDLGGDDGRLGRPVAAADDDAGHRFEDAADRLLGDDVGAGEHVVDAGEGGRVLFGDDAEQAGGQMGRG